MDNLTNQSLFEFVSGFPQGVSAGEIEREFKAPRTSLNRRLKELIGTKQLIVTGKGPATRYASADSLAPLRLYFAKPYTEPTQAPYNEARLAPLPSLSAETEQKFSQLPQYILDKRELSKFLIDFSCASSALEGGTYSLLDTQALIEYGEKAADKPVRDAFLVLNHKDAFEYLYDHMELGSIYKVQDQSKMQSAAR